jgi:hypothetical protein
MDNNLEKGMKSSDYLGLKMLNVQCEFQLIIGNTNSWR